MQVDDKDASSAETEVTSTWRKSLTSSLRLPVSKSKRNKNRRQANSLPLDETTKLKGTVNDLAADDLLTSRTLIAVSETETEDNDAIANETSVENYIRLADDEDQSWAGCRSETDEHEKSCVNIEASNNSQMSGTLLHTFVFFSRLITVYKGVMFLPRFFCRLVVSSVFLPVSSIHVV